MAAPCSLWWLDPPKHCRTALCWRHTLENAATEKPWPDLSWDESLTAIQQWKEVCMSACKLPFQIGKQPAHSNSAGCPPQLQFTVLLLFNGPRSKISVWRTSHCPRTEKRDTPLIWLPSKTGRGQQEGEGLWALWLCWPASGILSFLFQEVETTSSLIKWDVLTSLACQTVTANRLVWNAFLKK